MLLIFPPAAKACEPPGGISILGGALKAHDVNYQIIDMNLESSNYFLDKYFKTHPKKRHYLDLITSRDGYTNLDRYGKVLNELTTGINYSVNKNEYGITLSNFIDKNKTPHRSEDLIDSAKNYRDNPYYEYYKIRMGELLIDRDVKHIGLSIQFLNQALPAFALIGFLRSNYPNIKIVIGGGLTTSWVKGPNWKNPFSGLIDKIIAGPGEEALLTYLGVDPQKELLSKSLPDYDYTLNYNYYNPGVIIPINGAMGCGWKKCTFCPEQAEDNPFIPKGAKRVINELYYLKERYKPDLFHFLDSEVSPSLLKAIAESNNTTPWYGFTKFYPLLKNLDFCKKLKMSGCEMLKLGLESGDQVVLDSMNKGIHLEDVKIILKNLKEAKIKTFIYLLFGTPTEEYLSARKTMDFVVEFYDTITFLNLAIFNLPVGSDLAKSQKLFSFGDADLTMYTGFEHPKGWNRREVRDFLNREFKADPKIRNILKRTPPVYNANHGIFFNID